MSVLLYLLLLLGVILILAYLRLPQKLWSASLLVALLALSLLDLAPFGLQAVVWLLALAVIVPLNVDELRKTRLTQPLLDLYKKIAPQISDTERAALDAGTVGWEGELFSGKPDWGRLLDPPRVTLREDEQAFLDGPVEEVCRMTHDWQITYEDADLPPEIWDFLKKNKFFGMIIPKSYGGLEFSATAHALVLQKLASISSTLSSTVTVPNSLGPAELIHRYGTQEQKDYYLPRLAVGEELPCFALTGPFAGSDATSLPDVGVVCEQEIDGKKVLGVRLTFEKRYITLAPVATVIGLAFQLKDPEGLLGGEEERGITLGLLPRDTEGLQVGNRHYPLDIPFLNGTVRGKDVFMPLSQVIGGQDYVGQGWRMLVECLSVGRAISLPAGSAGATRMAAFATGAYARIRRQFNMPVGRFEGVEEALARIGGRTYKVAALSAMTTAAVDRGESPSVPSAIAKYHTTQTGREIIKDAMDIHGGKGIVLGPRNYLGRSWQGAPISITVEGANILTRSLMIYGQGAIRCHPYVLEEMEAAAQNDLDRFDKALFGHIGHSISNAARAFLLGLTGGWLSQAPGNRDTRRFYRQLNRYSAALAFASDVAMGVLGGKLKRKEKLSARLGDVLSELYICSAVLRQWHDQGAHSADLPLVKWACYESVYNMQEALHQFILNFPVRPVAWLLRLMIFPLGTRSVPPSDRLGHKVAALLLSPTETRQRLAGVIFTTPSDNNPVGRMNESLKVVIAAEPIERKLHKAVKAGELSGSGEALWQAALEQGLINEEEQALLRKADAERLEVITVDEFPPGYLGHHGKSKAGGKAKK